MKRSVKIGATVFIVCAGILGLLWWLVGPRVLLRMNMQDAYVKINAPGELVSSDGNGPGSLKVYQHTLTAVFKDKTTKNLQVNSAGHNRPLRAGAYLLLKVNAHDGVESFEEVTRKDVPPDIADMLDKQPNTITSNAATS